MLIVKVDHSIKCTTKIIYYNITTSPYGYNL